MATEEMKLWHPPTFISPIDETLYEDAVNFPDEFPYEFDSFTPNYAPNSPVESKCSAIDAESSSDHKEFFASLTQLHHSRPIHVTPPTMDLPEMKKWVSAASPQSIVAGFEVLSGRRSISSNKSPTGRSQFSSPLTIPCNADNSTLGLINEVARQVAELKMNFEEPKYRQNICPPNVLNNCSRGCVSSPGKPYEIPSSVQPNVSQNYSTITQHQQAPRLQPLQLRSIHDFVKQDKLYRESLEQQKEHIRQLVIGIEYGGLRAQRTWSSSQSLQVPLHCRRLNHPPVFYSSDSSLSSLCLSNVKRESSGTGVFLPRGYGKPPPSGKRTVVPPEVFRRINISNIINHPGAQLLDVLSSDGKQHFADLLDHEVLPQNWTY